MNWEKRGRGVIAQWQVPGVVLVPLLVYWWLRGARSCFRFPGIMTNGGWFIRWRFPIPRTGSCCCCAVAEDTAGSVPLLLTSLSLRTSTRCDDPSGFSIDRHWYGGSLFFLLAFVGVWEDGYNTPQRFEEECWMLLWDHFLCFCNSAPIATISSHGTMVCTGFDEEFCWRCVRAVRISFFWAALFLFSFWLVFVPNAAAETQQIGCPTKSFKCVIGIPMTGSY